MRILSIPFQTSVLVAAVLIESAAVGFAEPQTGGKFIERLRTSPAVVLDTAGQAIDPERVPVVRVWQGTRCKSRLTNRGKEPVRLGNIILFDLAAHGLPPETPVYGEGFQMVSQNAGTLAQLAYRGAYPDAVHYRIPEPGGIPTAYGMMTLDLGGGGHVLLGFSSCRRFIGRFSFNGELLRVSLDPEGLELLPGETWELEEFIAMEGGKREALLDQFATDINRNHPPLPQPPPDKRSGWCTWYGVGGAGNQKIVSDAAAFFAAKLPELKFIQIDEGYTLEGDLADVDPAFGDMAATADAIRATGLLPAIWVGPFVAAPQSRVLAGHPEWFVQGPDGKPLDSSTVGFGGWKNGPWRALDGSHPEAAKWLEETFRMMRTKYGFTYFKLDANYWGTIHAGKRHDPKATRVEAYRRGMEALVRGAGPDAVILGCNAPMWPSLGLVNAMRTGGDVARSFDSMRNMARENLPRGWQNGRLWVLDPDCVMLGGELLDQPGQPSRAHLRQLDATIIHACGGLVMSGDKIEDLGPEQIAMLRKLVPSTGKSATVHDPDIQTATTDLGSRQYHYAFNWSDKPADRRIQLKQRSRLTNFWSGEDLGVHEGEYTIQVLAAQSAMLLVAEPVK